MRFCVFSSDPLYKYYEKGEIKTRYWNPQGMFAEVYVFSFCDRDIEPGKVQELAGGARLEIIPLGPPNPLRLHAQYRLAVEKLSALRPDLVRVHNPWHAGMVGIRAARRLGLPVVLSLHTHYGARRRWERRWLLQVLRLCEWYSIRQADRVLCVSHYVGEYARRMGAKSVEVIYNWVYADQFECERRGFGSLPVILSVGRLDPPKDQECLIRAIQGLEVELHLVGDGVNRSKLERLAAELKVAQKVRFVGAVPHAEIQHYFARADIFAMATYYEGFCIPVLEAMAAGLPIVVSATDPLSEILGGQGEVVPHDPQSFHLALERLIREPDRALGLGRAARTRALELDGHLMEAREAEFYSRVMAEKRETLHARGIPFAS